MCALGFATAGRGDTVTYTLTHLCPYGPATPEDINNNLQVVGGIASAGATVAWLWQNGVISNLGGSPGATHNWANSINASGQIVGHSGGPSLGGFMPFLWSASGGMTSLGVLPGHVAGAAKGINTQGQVVGDSDFSGGGVRAFLWSPGGVGMTDLGVFPGQDRSSAHAINDAGKVVGQADTLEGSRAFLWSAFGGMTVLGDLRGAITSNAVHINAAGQIVGSYDTDSGLTRAVLWSASGEATDLGVLHDFTSSEATHINAGGQVVGYCWVGTELRAWVWDAAHGMIDLNTRLDATGAGWTLYQARAINDTGHIVGFGRNPGGQERAFLLTPKVPPIIAGIPDRTILTGATYAETPVLTQGGIPITWSITSGPPTMSIDSSTGAVTWPTPTTIGSPFTVTIRATNDFGFDEESWLLTVNGPPVIAEIADQTIAAGQAYSQAAVLTQGTAPVSWSVVSGPAGWSSTGTAW